MFKWPFKWSRTLPGLGRADRRALQAYVWLTFACVAQACTYVGYLFLPPKLVSKCSIAFLFVAFMVAIWMFMSSRLKNPRMRNVWGVGLVLIGWCTAKGLISNYEDYKSLQEIISQAFFMLALLYVASIGWRGVVLTKMFPFFLGLFYFFVIIMIATQGLSIAGYDAAGVEQQIDMQRNTTSMSYLFKAHLLSAPFFFLLGCFWRRRLNPFVRFLCIVTIVPFAYYLIYLFKFRTGIALLGLTMCLAAYYSMKTIRVKQMLVVGAVVITGVLFYLGKSTVELRERIDQANERHRTNNIYEMFKGERFDEATLLFEQLSLGEIIYGRGFNASFDASDMFGEAGLRWKSCHLGFVSNVLRGGIIFAVFYFLFFVRACFRRLHDYEKRDGFMIACKGFVIVETIHYFSNPMQVGIYYLAPVMILYLCLGALWSDRYVGDVR